MDVEEEREPVADVVSAQATAPDDLLDIGDPVGEGEGEFLRRRRAGLANVVAADRDRVETRHLGRAELDHVGDDAHRRCGRGDPLLLRDELLEHVVLDRAAERVPGDAAAAGDREVHREQDRGRAVHGHRRRHLIERDPVEEDLHVLDRRHRHALAADLATRARVVGVEAHQRGHVEGGREPVLTLAKQEVEAVVGVLRRAESGELAHCPAPAAVHRRIGAAQEREDSGRARVAARVLRSVDRFEWQTAGSRARILRVGHRRLQAPGDGRVSRRRVGPRSRKRAAAAPRRRGAEAPSPGFRASPPAG